MNLTGELTADGVVLTGTSRIPGMSIPSATPSRPHTAGRRVGVATGNVGDEGALDTEYTLPYTLFRALAV